MSDKCQEMVLLIRAPIDTYVLIPDKFVKTDAEKENRPCSGLMCMGCSNNGVCEQQKEFNLSQ